MLSPSGEHAAYPPHCCAQRGVSGYVAQNPPASCSLIMGLKHKHSPWWIQCTVCKWIVNPGSPRSHQGSSTRGPYYHGFTRRNEQWFTSFVRMNFQDVDVSPFQARNSGTKFQLDLLIFWKSAISDFCNESKNVCARPWKNAFFEWIKKWLDVSDCSRVWRVEIPPGWD